MTDAVHDEAPENVDPTIVGVPNYDRGEKKLATMSKRDAAG